MNKKTKIVSSFIWKNGTGTLANRPGILAVILQTGDVLKIVILFFLLRRRFFKPIENVHTSW